MDYTYPEYYYSKEIKSLLLSKPELPIKPIEPTEPSRPIDPGTYDGGGNNIFWIVSLLAGIIGFFYTISSGSDVDNPFTICLLCIGLILIGWFSLKMSSVDKESHEEKRRNYEQQLRDYPTQLNLFRTAHEHYLEELSRYEKDVERIMSEKNISIFRKEQIANWISQRSTPTFMPCTDDDVVKKGVSEHIFVGELERHNFHVLVDQKIPVGDKYYYPDILIEQDGIYIDIEIDEPYSGNDGTPIHYLYEEFGTLKSIDKDRNQYIANQGFEIIRLSEEQIFLHTFNCISFIRSFINSIKEGSENLFCPDAFILKKWTKEDSYKLAFQRFRHTYVPSNLQKNLTDEVYRSYYEMREGIGAESIPY